MPDFPYNVSYGQTYTVVSRTATSVTLRPDDGALLSAYWKEFVSGELPDGGSAPGAALLKVTGLPYEVQRVDTYSPYTLSYPTVILSIGGKDIDVSQRVTARRPDTQTPGLYRVDYLLPLPGHADNPVWQTYVSIEEPPVLRHVITPWARSSYTVSSLTRLVLEPQFQEALYEEGAPLYNFVTANMPPALRPHQAAAFAQCTGYKSGDCLFITGGRLPLASHAVLDVGPGDSFIVHLSRHISAQAWARRAYPAGAAVNRNKKAYIALLAATASDIPGSSAVWAEGGLYSLQEMSTPDGSPASIYYRWKHADDGAIDLSAVWAPVDLRGYIFHVDVMHAPRLGTYWGHYDRKYFNDYAPGDIVLYISEGVLYLYRRNGTDIRDASTEEAYRPGDYRNPHWDEVYAAWDGGQLRSPNTWVRPVSNAGDAVIAKTGSLSEDICRAYAQLLGIPNSIVDAIGPKGSVFLFVLLQRTRNTYEGFRDAFRAIGLSVEDLQRVYPTVSADDGHGNAFTGIYPEADTLQYIARAVRYDLVWQGAGDPPDIYGALKGMSHEEIEALDLHWVRYASDGAHGDCIIQEYRGHAWSDVYCITGFGDAHMPQVQGNNRYYRATLSVLRRLAAQALVDLGDGKEWISLNAFSSVSPWVTDIMQYEVPAYIYLVLTARLASLGNMHMAGYGERRIAMGALGGTPTLAVHPTRYFDLATCTVKEIRARVLIPAERGLWATAVPSRMCDGAAVYVFDRATAVRFYFEGGVAVTGYWASRYTEGLLGTNGSTPEDATEITGDTLEIANGLAAVTPLADASTLTGSMEYPRHNYTLDGEWALDGTTPFASYVGATPMVFGTWLGDIAQLATAIAAVKAKDGTEVQYSASAVGQAVRLDVYGIYPEEIYIYGKHGALLAMVRIPGLPRRAAVADLDGAPTMKITLEKA